MRKLLKYEFKSVFYLMLPLYLVFVVVSAACRLFINVDFLQDMFNGLPFFFVNMVYFGLFVAMMVISLLMVVQRFYKGLLSEEGYLMFTLPVRTWQLILSKGIVATVTVIASGVVTLLSLFILTMNLGDIWSMFTFDQDVIVFSRLFEMFPTWPLFALEFVLLMFVYLWKHIAHAYSAMAFGQLANKNRVILSFVVYGAQWLGISFFWLMVVSVMNKLHFQVPHGLSHGHEEFFMHFGMWMLMVWQGLELAFYYITTHWILSRHLNLE